MQICINTLIPLQTKANYYVRVERPVWKEYLFRFKKTMKHLVMAKRNAPPWISKKRTCYGKKTGLFSKLYRGGARCDDRGFGVLTRGKL